MVESTSSPLAALKVLYALSDDNRWSGIPKPPCLTLWNRIFRKLALIPFPPNSAGKFFSLRASSIGPVRVPTLGKILCSYCHLSCNNIPKPE